MPIISDISHHLSTTDAYSQDLEVQWSPINLGHHVKLLSFDRLGRFCAVYTDDRLIRLCDTRCALLPMTLLPLNPVVSKTDYHCQAMAWSQCGSFLLASLSRTTTKRKLNQADLSSILVMWHIPSQRIVYKISVPIIVNAIHLAPSNDVQQPSFILSSQQFPIIFILDAFNGKLVAIDQRNHSSHSIPAVDLNAAEMDVYMFQYADTSSQEMESDSAPSNMETFDYRTICQYQFSKVNPILVSSSRIIRSKYSEQRQITTLSTIELSLEESQLTPHYFLDNLSLNHVQRPQQIMLNNDSSKMALVMVDRIFLFHINQIGEDSSHVEITSATTCNVSTQVAYQPRSPFQLTAEFYGFPRNTRHVGVQFLSRAFDSERAQSMKLMESLLIVTNHQLDRLHATSDIILWDYSMQEKVINNKLGTMFAKSPFIVIIPNALISSEIYVQPLAPQVGPMLRDRPQPLFAIDMESKLWNCANFYWSRFPGPMYPVGYRLIQQVKDYIETEEELDTTVIPSLRKPLKKKSKNEIPKSEVPTSTSSSCRKAPLNCRPSLSIEPYAQYLQQLPLSLQAFLAKNSGKRQVASSSSSSAVNHSNFTSPVAAKDGVESSLHRNHEIGDTQQVRNIQQEDMEEDTKTGPLVEAEENMSTSTSDAKREIFSSSLKSFMPIPTRVLAGDFELKLQRDRVLNDSIRAAIADKELAAERMRQTKEEAIRQDIKKIISREKSRINMEEKRKQRNLKKQEALNSIFSAAIERENNEKARKEVHLVLDHVIRMIEHRYRAQLHGAIQKQQQQQQQHRQIVTNSSSSTNTSSITSNSQKPLPNVNVKTEVSQPPPLPNNSNGVKNVANLKTTTIATAEVKIEEPNPTKSTQES